MKKAILCAAALTFGAISFAQLIKRQVKSTRMGILIDHL